MMRQAGADVQALRPLRGRADARAWTPTPPYRAQRPPKKIQKKIWAQVPRGLTTRGATDKQGSRLVRWAAVEAVQRVPGHTRLRAATGTGSPPAAAATSASSRPPAS